MKLRCWQRRRKESGCIGPAVEGVADVLSRMIAGKAVKQGLRSRTWTGSAFTLVNRRPDLGFVAEKLEPPGGFEPPTYGLQIRCSTTELGRLEFTYC